MSKRVKRAKPIPSSNSFSAVCKSRFIIIFIIKSSIHCALLGKLLFSGRRHYHHRRLFRFFLDFSQATLADQVDKQTEQSQSSSTPPHHRQQLNQFLLFASIVTSD